MAGKNAPESTEPKRKLFYGYIIVLLSCLTLAMHAGSRGAFGIFLKPMLTDLGLTRGMISSAFSLSLLMTGLLSILAGRLADRFGPRRIITLCGICMGLGYVLMSQASAIWQLYIFYGALIGIGSTVYVPVVSTVTKWFTTNRNVMTGIVGAGGATGTLIAPLVANWLISAYDWRLSFAVMGILILLVITVSAQFMKREPNVTERIVYDESTMSTITAESRTHAPNQELSLQKAIFTGQFWLTAMIFFVIGFCSYSIIVHIAPHATDEGISPANAAIIVSTIGGVSIAGRLGMGRLGDILGVRRAILIGFIVMTAAMVWLTLAKESWMLFPFAAVFGFSWGTGTVGSPLIAELFGLRAHGAILGACNLGYSLGVAMGPLMAGYIFDITGSYQLAFLIITIMACMGILVTALLRPMRAK